MRVFLEFDILNANYQDQLETGNSLELATSSSFV